MNFIETDDDIQNAESLCIHINLYLEIAVSTCGCTCTNYPFTVDNLYQLDESNAVFKFNDYVIISLHFLMLEMLELSNYSYDINTYSCMLYLRAKAFGSIIKHAMKCDENLYVASEYEEHRIINMINEVVGDFSEDVQSS